LDDHRGNPESRAIGILDCQRCTHRVQELVIRLEQIPDFGPMSEEKEVCFQPGFFQHIRKLWVNAKERVGLLKGLVLSG
jgi:hypothetical protein